MAPMGDGAATPPALSPQHERLSLNIVRLALVMGVISFGVVAFTLERSGGSRLGSPEALAIFRAVAIGLLALGLGAFVVIRSRIGDVTDPGKQRTMCIIGYALCEAPALAGGVIWILGGGLLFYGLGLGLLLAAVTLLAPQAQNAG
jgi:hypothetical protein